MILPRSFTKNWILQHRNQFPKVDPGIIEKMIQAFALVEALQLENLKFIFKGGTCLILLLKSPQRFSVDIDIITMQNKIEIEKVLKNICQKFNFSHYELDESRNKSQVIPKTHYFLYFQSQLDGKEKYIMLDILFEQNPYQEIIEIPIKANWLQTSSDITLVKAPSIESIAGDKLTAFAPNTTGVRYQSYKELEIIKQLFDLGQLFYQIQNFKVVRDSFLALVKKEIDYRKLAGITFENVLDDIIETSLLLSSKGAKIPEAEQVKYNELQDGIKRFKSFLIYEKFRIDEAILAASKVALMAAKIKAGDMGSLNYFEDRLDITRYLIESTKYNHLNKLKKIPGGALFYWYHTVKLLA